METKQPLPQITDIWNTPNKYEGFNDVLCCYPCTVGRAFDDDTNNSRWETFVNTQKVRQKIPDVMKRCDETTKAIAQLCCTPATKINKNICPNTTQGLFCCLITYTLLGAIIQTYALQKYFESIDDIDSTEATISDFKWFIWSLCFPCTGSFCYISEKIESLAGQQIGTQTSIPITQEELEVLL